MPKVDVRKETIDAILRRIADLNDQSLTQLSQYISYLKWQEELWNSLLDEEARPGPDQALLWQFDFLEAFPAARLTSTREPSLMEIKVDSATCGMVQQLALWQHPPVVGSAVCEYNLNVPPEVDSLRLQFAVGIRDGALMEGDNLCAFRIYVNGVRIWSITKQTQCLGTFCGRSAQPGRPGGHRPVCDRRPGRYALELGRLGRARRCLAMAPAAVDATTRKRLVCAACANCRRVGQGEGLTR